MNEDIIKNSVSAKGQTKYPSYTEYADRDNLRVLFMGNSITLHEPAPEIGWNFSHGMAASTPECDYVHLVKGALEKAYGSISCCVANVALFERDYANPEALTCFDEAKNFRPDIVIFRFGENINRDLLGRVPLAPRLKDFYSYFSEGAKRVIVTDLFWDHESIRLSIEEAAEALGYTLVSIKDLGESDENKAIGLFQHEGVALHPCDLGMKRIAKRLTDALGL